MFFYLHPKNFISCFDQFITATLFQWFFLLLFIYITCFVVDIGVTTFSLKQQRRQSDTKAADIVIDDSILHSVIQCCPSFGPIVCNNGISYLLLGGEIMSISVTVGHNKESTDPTFQMFVDVEHQL